MTCHIRLLAFPDFVMAGDVIRAAFGTVADDFGLTEENCPANGAFLREEVLFAEAKAGAVFYGFFEEGRLMGVAALKRKGKGLFYLEKLAVLPQAPGRSLSLGVMYENRRLAQWYEGAGFLRTGTKIFLICPS